MGKLSAVSFQQSASRKEGGVFCVPFDIWSFLNSIIHARPLSALGFPLSAQPLRIASIGESRAASQAG
jgi:hypothetical protein